MEEILLKLGYLKYPFTINDNNLFWQSLISPTQIRKDTIEWLFHKMEGELINNIFINNEEQITRLQILFKFFGIIETKDNILGLSTDINNQKCLLNLINFTIKYINIKSNNQIEFNEINKSISLISFMDKNKIELFKDDIRLFIPEINGNIINKENKINNKYFKDNIEQTKLLIKKVDGKLEKLNTLNINYDIISKEDEMELFKTIINFNKSIEYFLKDFNTLYEKELKYISPEKLPSLQNDINNFNEKYNELENIASLLEEIFAIHNKIISFKIIK
jgi:hypothetical protein